MIEQVDAATEFELPNESWLSRSKTKLALGGLAISVSLSVAFDPIGKTMHTIHETAPWVATGLIAGEAAWIGGAAIALVSVGRKIPKNPLNIHRQFSEIMRSAKDSKLLRTGLAINMAGALGQFGVATAGVLELPRESWGMLSLPAADLALTAIRGGSMWQIIKNPKQTEIEGGGNEPIQ